MSDSEDSVGDVQMNEELSEPYCTFGVDGQKVTSLSDWRIDMSKIRGSMVKWAREVDEIKVDKRSFENLMHRWYDWMTERVSNFRRIVKSNGQEWDRYERVSYQELASEIGKLYNNHDEFSEMVDSKIVIKDKERNKGDGPDGQEDDSRGPDNDDSDDGDTGDPDSDGDSSGDYSGKFADLMEIGILNEDKTVDKDKIRGAMMEFARGVDAIEVDSMSPEADGAKQAFNTWMMDRFGNTWVLFISTYMDPGDLRDLAEAMFERHDEYRSLVEEKWEYKPGNSKESGDDESGQKDNSPDSLSGWAEREGSMDKESGERQDSGDEDSGARHKSRRYRLMEWSDVTADKDDMWELEEIRNTIIRESVWTALDKIPSNTVDCVVTSPPYWNLRDYDGEDFDPIGGEVGCDHSFNNGRCYRCDAWKGQLGHEPEPQMFIDNIVAIMQKIRRILKPTGSLFLNIGDNFADQDYNGDVRCKRKSMMAIPYRIYIDMMDLEWVMRNPIVWVKRILFDDDTVRGAANPTSVKDRINHTYEPMWWFVNSPDYYSDIFAVRREHQTEAQDMSDYGGKYGEGEIEDEMYNSPTARAAREGYEPSLQHDAGANIPDAWRVPTGNAGKEHPAVFSPRLPARPIRMASPKHTCANCLKPYVRVVEDGEHKGWEKQCRCDTGERSSGIVFEPFCGRGTTPKAAEDAGRDWITTEVSDKYADFAESYITGTKKSELGDFM